jgi:hypothetical protein
MKSILRKVTPFLAGFALALLMVSVAIAPLGTAQTQGGGGTIASPLGSLNPNYTYYSTFTASGQSTTQAIPGLSTVMIGVTGTALTTVTWQITCSPDSGVTYYGVPSTSGVVNATYFTIQAVTAGTITTTSSGTAYWVNLAGCNKFKLTTSGTFTATNVTIRVTGSYAKGII